MTTIIFTIGAVLYCYYVMYSYTCTMKSVYSYFIIVYISYILINILSLDSLIEIEKSKLIYIKYVEFTTILPTYYVY